MAGATGDDNNPNTSTESIPESCEKMKLGDNREFHLAAIGETIPPGSPGICSRSSGDIVEGQLAPEQDRDEGDRIIYTKTNKVKIPIAVNESSFFISPMMSLRKWGRETNEP